MGLGPVRRHRPRPPAASPGRDDAKCAHASQRERSGTAPGTPAGSAAAAPPRMGRPAVLADRKPWSTAGGRAVARAAERLPGAKCRSGYSTTWEKAAPNEPREQSASGTSSSQSVASGLRHLSSRSLRQSSARTLKALRRGGESRRIVSLSPLIRAHQRSRRCGPVGAARSLSAGEPCHHTTVFPEVSRNHREPSEVAPRAGNRTAPCIGVWGVYEV